MLSPSRGPERLIRIGQWLIALLFAYFLIQVGSSLIADLPALGKKYGIETDWTSFADDWRGLYQPQMGRVRKGELPWTRIDDLHKEAFEMLLAKRGDANGERALKQRPRLVQLTLVVEQRRQLIRAQCYVDVIGGQR